MISENLTHWLSSKSLGEIAAMDRYSTNSARKRKRTTIDVPKLLQDMAFTDRSTRSSFRLDLGGIRQLSINREEKWAIYKIALRLLLPANRKGEEANFFSQGYDESQESLQIFLEHLTKGGKSPFFEKMGQETISLLLPLIAKIHQTWEGEERDILLQQLAMTIDSFENYQSYFLQQCNSKSKEELSSLLEMAIALHPLQQRSIRLLYLLSSLMKLDQKEGVSFVKDLLTRRELFGPHATSEILSYLCSLSSPEERKAFLEIIDIPSLAIFLHCEATTPSLSSATENGLTIIHTVFRTLPKEEREPLLQLAITSCRHCPTPYAKIRWLQTLALILDQKKRQECVELSYPLLSHMDTQSQPLVNLIKDCSREKLVHLSELFSPIMSRFDHDLLLHLIKLFLNLQPDELSHFPDFLTIPSLPDFLPKDEIIDTLQLDELYRKVQTISHHRQEPLFQLVIESCRHFPPAIFPFHAKMDWLLLLSSLADIDESSIHLYQSLLDGLSHQAAVDMVETMRKVVQEERRDLLNDIVSFLATFHPVEQRNLRTLCQKISPQRLQSLLTIAAPLVSRTDTKGSLLGKMAILQALDQTATEKRAANVQLLHEFLTEKQVDRDLIAFFLKTIAPLPFEDSRALLKDVMALVDFVVSRENFEVILAKLQTMTLTQRANLISTMVAFYNYATPEVHFWSSINHLRLINLLSSLTQKESLTILIEGGDLLNSQETLSIFDLLRHFSAAGERAKIADRLCAIFEDVSSELPINDRILSHLLTIVPERRELFLSALERRVKQIEEQLSKERVKNYIDALGTLLILYPEEDGNSCLTLLDECLDHSLHPLQRFFTDPRFANFAQKGHLHLISQSEKGYLPEETELHIATTLIDQGDFLPEDHPLAQWAIPLFTRHDSEALNRKNPWKIHAELKQILATEPLIELQKEELPTFKVTISATGEIFLCQWNLNGIRHLHQKRGGDLQHTAASIPEGITHTTLDTLYRPMRERLQAIADEIYQKSELTPAQVQEFFDSPFILSRCQYLDPSLPRERSLPRNALQLSFIIKKIDDASPTIPATGGLSPREELLLTLASSVQSCSTGMNNAINDYYNAIEPTYRRLVGVEGPQDFLDDLLQKALDHLCSQDKLLLKFIEEDEDVDRAHAILFLKNRLTRQLGLRHTLEFDPHTLGLPDSLLEFFQRPQAIQEAIKIFLHHLSIDDLFRLSSATQSSHLLATLNQIKQESATATMTEQDTLQQRSRELLEEIKSLSAPFQQSLFAPQHFVPTSTMIARGFGHTEADDYTLTAEESNRLFDLDEELMEEGIIPLTEEMVLRMLFATVISAKKITNEELYQQSFHP